MIPKLVYILDKNPTAVTEAANAILRSHTAAVVLRASSSGMKIGTAEHTFRNDRNEIRRQADHSPKASYQPYGTAASLHEDDRVYLDVHGGDLNTGFSDELLEQPINSRVDTYERMRKIIFPFRSTEENPDHHWWHLSPLGKNLKITYFYQVHSLASACSRRNLILAMIFRTLQQRLCLVNQAVSIIHRLRRTKRRSQ